MNMTDDQASRLFDIIERIRSEVSELKIVVAVQAKQIDDIPNRIKSALQGQNLRYACYILSAVTAVGWYCLQVIIPNMIKKMIGG